MSGQGDSGNGPGYEYQGGQIRLDREGRWFHEDVEITHKLTLDLFNRSIQKDPAGGYMLVIGLEYSHIEVEDTPYFVKGTELEGEKAEVRLSDGTEEELDLTTIEVGGDNVLYCRVKNGEFPARFTRPAYYQLMEALVETDEGYGVKLGDKVWPVKTRDEN